MSTHEALDFDAGTADAEPRFIDALPELGNRVFRERELPFEGKGETLHGLHRLEVHLVPSGGRPDPEPAIE